MDTHTMIRLMQLNLADDEDHSRFPIAFKKRALNDSAAGLCAFLRPELLTELEYLKASVSITTGYTGLLTSATLDFNPLNGGEGIVAVRDSTTGRFLKRTTIEQVTDHYVYATIYDPFYYILGNRIYVLPATGITAVDVYFMRQPDDMIYNFTASGNGSTTTITSTSTDLALANNAGQAENYYAGTLIYNETTKKYHPVTASAYDAGTYTFTVNQPAIGSPASTNDILHFETNIFDEFVGVGIQCPINPSFHHLIENMSEAACWRADEKGDLAQMALDMTYEEIKYVNELYIPPAGVGTSAERRAQGK